MDSSRVVGILPTPTPAPSQGTDFIEKAQKQRKGNDLIGYSLATTWLFVTGCP